MKSKQISFRFAAIYDSLPADAQQALVEKQLMPLLHSVAKDRSRRVLDVAQRLQKKHADIPKLDIKAKKVEINGLMEELHRDTKRSFLKERSQKTELLSEIVDSLVNWLDDIWVVVYEHNVNFPLAHNCLLFVAHSLDHIGHGRTGCSCAFVNMFIPLILKRSDGRRVKTFTINGAHNLEEVLLFIWRDLFLSLLATGRSSLINKVPEMLMEIEELLGWTALERLLYGGKRCPHEADDDDEFWTDDEDDGFVTESDDDLSDCGDFDPEWDPQVYSAAHWTSRVRSQTSQLRHLVLESMIRVFELSPSLRLYSALLAVSTDPDSTEVQVARHLATIATSCPDTFAAALEIYAHEDDADTLAALLSSHSHLLRPRDARVLQGAVTCMAPHHEHTVHALQIVERELLDTARTVRHALLAAFSQLDAPAARAELQELLRQRPGAAGRQARVEAWVDAAATPGAAPQNPMAFAALLMGLPLPPDLDGADEDHTAGFLDFDPHDPDLDDLRDEFRPKLKQRFEGWSDVARAVKGGQPVQMKVYKMLIEMMPFLRANDVVEEMVNRLADKPSKHHVCDGLDALLNFVKIQRRKASMQKLESKARREASKPLSPGTASASAGPSTPPDAAPQPPPGGPSILALLGLTAAAPNTGMGGMEDVD